MQIRHIRNTRNRKKWTIMHFTNTLYPDKMKHDTMVTITNSNKKNKSAPLHGSLRDLYHE